ncbi:DUF1330 domain-containing protein [Streptomyces sp. Ru73]|uniref:DUF1330 domain-containing protein n=1 Tax=Streptomyces sp. Ru73 TaxID=2080748 RepID=UPI000CDDA6F1|nr:DUF1330 domain-containing protein [Streptomyces sp. Ru73]POX41441.1 DUF1330 domain-containing protein [Streptomyces sp. Ru73]
MSAYAVAHLKNGSRHEDVLSYMERIQETMDPFGGRFLVHGTTVEVREGTWPGHLVMIEFPDLERARAWYDSPAYQELVPLRTRHIDADIVLAAGVPEGYEAAHTAAAARREAEAAA